MLLFLFLACQIWGAFGLYASEKYIKTITPDSFEEVVLKSEFVWIIHFYEIDCMPCQSIIPEISKTSNVLSGIAKVGAMNINHDKTVQERFDLEYVNSVRIYADKESPHEYEKDKTAKHIASTVLGIITRDVKIKLQKNETHDDPYIIKLTDGNFDKLVMNSDIIWLVQFFTPWCQTCKTMIPEYFKTSVILNGIAKVGALNCEENKVYPETHNITTFPLIQIFAFKNDPIIYTDLFKAEMFCYAILDAINHTVLARLNTFDEDVEIFIQVVKLTDKNFDRKVLNSSHSWMVYFFDQMGLESLNHAPDFENAAKDMAPDMKFGAMDATSNTEIPYRYDVEKLPSILLFVAGKNKVVPYKKTINEHDITEFALEYLPDPPVIEITEDIFEKANQTLVISVLPNILDCPASCRTDYIDLLSYMAKIYRGNKFTWYWCEEKAQSFLEQALNVTGYPFMAMVDVKKSKYSLLSGPFTTDGIDDFLNGKGIVGLFRDRVLPKIIQTSPWNAEDKKMSWISQARSFFNPEQGKRKQLWRSSIQIGSSSGRGSGGGGGGGPSPRGKGRRGSANTVKCSLILILALVYIC